MLNLRIAAAGSGVSIKISGSEFMHNSPSNFSVFGDSIFSVQSITSLLADQKPYWTRALPAPTYFLETRKVLVAIMVATVSMLKNLGLIISTGVLKRV